MVAAQNGLTGYYFDNFGVDDNNVRHDFTGFKATRVDPEVNFPVATWGDTPPHASIAPTTWSVRWVGKVSVPAHDSYTFRLTNQSNDGARIFINGNNIADTWRNHLGPGGSLGSFANATSQAITLEAGMHDIVVETYNTLGNASAVLSWANSAAPTTFVTIPNANLFTK